MEPTSAIWYRDDFIRPSAAEGPLRTLFVRVNG
jgi:hypothetical protein